MSVYSSPEQPQLPTAEEHAVNLAAIERHQINLYSKRGETLPPSAQRYLEIIKNHSEYDLSILSHIASVQLANKDQDAA